jgi:hypothetical protein
MLLNKYIQELDRINQLIIHNLTIPFEAEGKQYNVSYRDLCMSYEWKCYENDVSNLQYESLKFSLGNPNPLYLCIYPFLAHFYAEAQKYMGQI